MSDGERQRLTGDDLMRIPDIDSRHELIDGVLIRLPFHTLEHGALLMTVGWILRAHLQTCTRPFLASSPLLRFA
jgi:hypothetical protein